MSPLSHDESQQPPDNPTLLCQICNKPVPIETARTNSDGKAVHSDCYLHEIHDHDGHVKKRSWLAIAKELSEEQDSAKFGELAEELNKALDEAEAERHPLVQKKPDRLLNNVSPFFL